MNRRRAFILSLPLLAVAVGLGGPYLASLRQPVCGVLAFVTLDGLSPGCATIREVRGAIARGQHDMQRRALREALGHFRMAAATSPEHVPAQLARAQAAQVLGEYAEALTAYHAAVAAGAPRQVRVWAADMADRIGDTDAALRWLEGAGGTPREHAWAGVRSAALGAMACASAASFSPRLLWSRCVPLTRRAYHYYMEASREEVPQLVFQLLVDSGRREMALALARERGWMRENTDYCGAHDRILHDETMGLIAMLARPDEADCLLELGVRVTDSGAARLGRVMLADRVARSRSAEVRERAATFLRYRLPQHEVSKVAEALNATGWRLQNVHDHPDEALAVFQKAIAADPRFSWPYHNIGRVHLARGENEQALAWLRKALEVNPNHWRAQFNYGVAAARLRRYPEALAAYQRALQMNPGDAHAYANIGWTLLSLGRDEEGARFMQTAVRMDASLGRERDYLNARFGRDARGGPTAASTR
jgi:tetratricopeptide (TPR) repeat protein